MNNDNAACCACLTVEYKPEELGDGHMRERWMCSECGMTFTKHPRVEKEITLLKNGLIAVIQLIDESAGVAGLHLNGDVAEWESLRTGGRYEEWLIEFDSAVNNIRLNRAE